MRGKRRTRDWPRSCDRWSRLSAIPTSWCRKPRPSSTRWNGTRASCVAGVAIPRHPLTARLPPSCHRRNRIRSISWSRAPGRSRKTFVRSPVSFRWTEPRFLARHNREKHTFCSDFIAHMHGKEIRFSSHLLLLCTRVSTHPIFYYYKYVYLR